MLCRSPCQGQSKCRLLHSLCYCRGNTCAFRARSCGHPFSNLTGQGCALVVSLAHGFHFLSTEVKKKFNNTISLSIYMAFLIGRSLDSYYSWGRAIFRAPHWAPYLHLAKLGPDRSSLGVEFSCLCSARTVLLSWKQLRTAPNQPGNVFPPGADCEMFQRGKLVSISLHVWNCL